MKIRSVTRAAMLAALIVFDVGCMQRTGGARLDASMLRYGLARPNDNREAAGTSGLNSLSIDLEAVIVGWRPDQDVDSAVTVQAFAERGRAAQIPGPLIRVRQGTEVRSTITNRIPDSTLVIYGLRAGTVANDTVHVAPGATREVRFRASAPGTFMYWGTTSHSPLNRRMGRDAQLTGAIVVDPSNDPGKSKADRVFVITLIDITPDSTKPAPHEDIWEIAVNGRSWPHTERLVYSLGDTARWRWVNGSNRPHPMHLHGFHFRVIAKGSGAADTAYTADMRRLAVTELMAPGSTFELEWALTRPGNWLVHCHMIPHIVPFPSRPDSAREHDGHRVTRHPAQSMAGLVLGVAVVDPARRYRTPAGTPSVRHRLLLQQATAPPGQKPRRGFVLQRGAEPRRDSVEVPGSPLVVIQGQRTSVTIVNRLSEAASIHWHGMELESVFDGVAGYSGVGNRRAPLIAAGDSFTVWFAPPRAGTYMYHSHMDEEEHLGSGMYAPLIVLEPGAVFDPATDIVVMMGNIPGAGGGFVDAVNGSTTPEPVTLRAGRRYRLRLINLGLAAIVRMELTAANSAMEQWRLVSKDGAAVPLTLSGLKDASVRIGVGEAYDFEWTPSAGQFTLLAQYNSAPGAPPVAPIYQRILIQP